MPEQTDHAEGIGEVRCGCANCPPKPATAPLDWDPDPGFGGVRLTRDGEQVLLYSLTVNDGPEASMTVQDFEDRAAGDPDHDWRFKIEAPLGGVIYQRHGEGQWCAIDRTEGFA